MLGLGPTFSIRYAGTYFNWQNIQRRTECNGVGWTLNHLLFSRVCLPSFLNQGRLFFKLSYSQLCKLKRFFVILKLICQTFICFL